MTKPATSLTIVLGLCAALAACNSKTSANETNFGAAVSQFFAKKGELCLEPIAWPVDVYEADQRQRRLYPDGPAGQMAALEAVGLAKGEDIVLPEVKVKARRYTMSEAAKPFLRTDAKQKTSLCYGRKSLDKVVRWAEPVQANGTEESNVIYTYKLSDVAPWARKPQVKEAFPSLGRNVDGERRQNEKLYVKLTPQGWEALGLND